MRGGPEPLPRLPVAERHFSGDRPIRMAAVDAGRAWTSASAGCRSLRLRVRSPPRHDRSGPENVRRPFRWVGATKDGGRGSSAAVDAAPFGESLVPCESVVVAN